MTPKRSFPKFWKWKIWLDQINSFHGLFYEKAILVSFLFFACFWPFLSFLPKSDRERVHLYSILFKLKKDKERAHPNNGLGSNCFTALAQERTSAMSLNSVNVDHMIIGTIRKRGSAKVGSSHIFKSRFTFKAIIFFLGTVAKMWEKASSSFVSGVSSVWKAH